MSSCCCCILGSCSAAATLPHALYKLVCMKTLEILSHFFSIFFFLSSSDICMLFKIALLFTTTSSAAWRLPNVLLLEKMCLISPALLADTLGAVTEGWGDLFPFLSVKEGGTCRSSCAFLNREYSLLELCWEHYGGQNISSANSVCLVPEQRLFALPGLSQAIAFIQSFKSIGVIMFMAQWLLLKVCPAAYQDPGCKHKCFEQ